MVSMVDTAPHIVDPKNPGAVDEIIHLGDYWNEEKMRKNKEAILRINKEVGRCFRRAYGYLAQAKLLNDEIESYYQDSGALNIAGLNKIALELISEIFPGVSAGLIPKERHLFASGITPKGPCNYFETIFNGMNKRYILTGEPGTGKSTIVEKIYRTALQLGYDVEAYHCSLVPSKLEHLLIPELGVAIVTSSEPHLYQTNSADTVVNTTDYVNKAALSPFQEDLAEAKGRYQSAFDRAVAYIARAKANHDKLEEYYIPNMDFNKINSCREKIYQRILNYAAEI